MLHDLAQEQELTQGKVKINSFRDRSVMTGKPFVSISVFLVFLKKNCCLPKGNKLDPSKDS
jgi:hypothetical protein